MTFEEENITTMNAPVIGVWYTALCQVIRFLDTARNLATGRTKRFLKNQISSWNHRNACPGALVPDPVSG